ncbi:hypothetical protein [Streptomyces sp. NPDC093544]|uniref:hypothetical protein n=1 Tax=Streptomyces sp. NPDC093544 TaxID=3155200 RepID=UPI00343A6B3C
MAGPRSPALGPAWLSLTDVDTVAGNEPFAAQILACCTELGLDPERMNPHGGSIALGEPYDAAGARPDHSRPCHPAPRQPQHRSDQRRRLGRARYGPSPGTHLVGLPTHHTDTAPVAVVSPG